ncbi:MAG: 4Fe-4S dicluster domain-containing protein [Candidatus Zixiibacteriota bacterium]
MGHTVGKDAYRRLAKKIDGLTVRVPYNETLHAILAELYTSEEAELLIKMPYGLSTLDEIERVTKRGRAELQRLLDSLSSKGLVMDLDFGGEYRYIISPLVVGIFEFTMMRTGGNLNTKEWARLLHSYLNDHNTFYKANLSKGQSVMPLRALPHEEVIDTSDYVEILDYEKASAIVEDADKFAIGICSCRHEKLHTGEKSCDISLETCSTLGPSTDYMIRHGFAKEVSKTEMVENLARSRELGLVLCADNVQQNVSFICHCCGCCCNVLLGISRFGYTNAVVTSSFIAEIDRTSCIECVECVDRCPINAISIGPNGESVIDESVCIGCGVCGLECSSGAMRLVKRRQRVLHPENTFHRVILQSLEQGTLQNLLFSNPQNMTHRFMRGFVGGFLKLPPLKRALMSDTLRSSFLDFMSKGA